MLVTVGGRLKVRPHARLFVYVTGLLTNKKSRESMVVVKSKRRAKQVISTLVLELVVRLSH